MADKNIANNISVMLEVSGTTQPRFSAAYPWHLLASDVNGREVATRTRGFSGSSPQLIGHLIQVVTSGRETLLLKECNPYIGKDIYSGGR